MMLSRVAENLFWVGRNVERSLHICRLLDATFQVELGEVDHLEAGQSPSGKLLPVRNILGLQEFDEPGEAKLMVALARMTFERASDHSVATLVNQAKENTRASQDVLGAEPFPQINRLAHSLGTKRMRLRFRESPSRALNRIAQNCMLFFALVDEGQSRESPWHFINLGRRIESIGMYSRVLFEGLVKPLKQGETPDFAHWTWLLNSCAAQDAFMKRHPRGFSPVALVDQLLLDPDFPHSIRFCVSQAATSLESIKAEVGLDRSKDADRLVGRMESLLRFTDAEELLGEGLEELLGEIQWTCDRVSERLYVAYF